ncbi:tRNA threonylcarbamoyladenosine biosynthesis protein TsaB [Actinobaculum suis]|uniref:tRNA (Adenosine(37)-N6)-threonylcarbamoyltransferase complex dimerization subunit type 1 TsaB n=1 Tax=Actinobaculum suis TaxID=1657 RepID=A0A1G7AVU8_9ACTO|nr:tRNA (adenosine(37)-N6)-threonylcarbamoyltransferase complex dimerization subunit type 1 TsaB [Actinobaculum suis]MDY5153436.1 tRNA (adenosine(37)-N6)-threonylcarbamoyltransferase complex dimerization subunit type 1 TsaB [Actinobaculum suis]SDE18076.1 tRNA threonylcarbamoyladenosine biosynthesis protein TsaB [Actinobaculum suis]
MIILTIDTSDQTVVGVVETNFGTVPETEAKFHTLARLVSADSRSHAENLTPMVSDALDAADVDVPEAIVAGTGPGAFTGLRAGLVTARTLAFAWDIPLYGVPSLDAMAYGALRAGATQVWPVIDARRKELYIAGARAIAGYSDVLVFSPPQIIKPAEVATTTHGAPLAVSRADLYPELAGAQLVLPEPEYLASIALSRLDNAADPEAALSTEPLYLRRPDVARGVAQKAGDGYRS